MALTIKEFQINELRAKIGKPLHGMKITNFFDGDDFRKVPNIRAYGGMRVEIRTWGFWCSFRPLLHHTSSAHNSHSAPEPLSLSNCIRLWGKIVLVQYGAKIWY